MSISVVINTCCLGPRASLLSSGHRPYAERSYFLRNVLLPMYTEWAPMFREVIVVGEYENGNGYKYVPCPSVYYNCADALIQRQAGYDALENKDVEWILFQHDDHLYDPRNIVPRPTAADVLSPARWTRLRGIVERLNNGEDRGHISGHGVLMRSAVLRSWRWDRVPPVFTWDVEASIQLDDAGFKRDRADTVLMWDMEMGSTPWA